MVSQTSPPRLHKQLLYSPHLLFFYCRPVWWGHQILWKLPQLELPLVSLGEEIRDSKQSHHSQHIAHWRTFVPIPIMGEIHLEQNKTLMDCQLPVHQVRRDKKHHIVWIWSFNSVAFAFSSMKESTSWNSCSPPASKPGESWKINCGLLLNENWSWTLWIPRYGIKVNDQIREMQKDHWVGTFEVGLICWWGNDERGVGYKAKRIYLTSLYTGSSFVLQTRLSSVVLPAFALPITRIRKWVYLARIFAASNGLIDTAVGARSAKISWMRIRAASRRRAQSEHLLQAIAKSLQFGLFSSLRRALVSHMIYRWGRRRARGRPQGFTV